MVTDLHTFRAHGAGNEVRKRVRSFAERHAADQSCVDRKQGIRDIVQPRHREQNCCGFAAISDAKMRTFSGFCDVGCSQLCRGIAAAGAVSHSDAVSQCIRLPEQKRIIRRNDQAAAVQTVQNLQLRFQNVLLRAEIADMRRADVRDDRMIGRSNMCQIINLSGMIHAHFDHRSRSFLRHVQDRIRDADVIIVIAGCCENVVFCSKHMRGHILDRGLAAAAGHTENAKPLRLALHQQMMRKHTVSLDRVRHDEVRDRRILRGLL